MKLVANKKFLSLVLFFLLIILLYIFTPLRDFFSRDNFDHLRLWIQEKGAWAWFVFILMYVGSSIFCLPGSVLTILSGALFGIIFGTLFVMIGSNVGALCAFFIGRFFGREIVEKWIGGRFEKLNQGIASHGFYTVLWLRLFPLMPYNFLNYALGLTKVSLKDYIFANLLGMFPGIFVYVSLGNAATHVSLSDPKIWTKIEVWGPFLLVILLSLLPRLFKKKKKDLEKLAVS